MRSRLAEVFRTRTRDEWTSRATGTDACLTPVLSPSEAAEHPHNVARGTFVSLDGHLQPSPAPRFDRTPAATPTAPHEPRADTESVLEALGYSPEDIEKLRADGVVA